jgi:cytoskeletal protein RodZ
MGPSRAVALPTPLIHRLGQIPESRSLDRLLRSRGWIALLGVLLIGLVFMQVSLLKLNAGMVLPTSDNVRYLGANGKRIGGAQAATNIPSQGEASTALLPTVPGETTLDGAAVTGTTATTATPTEPQTTSSVPDAALAQQQAADAAAAAAAEQQTQAPTTPQTTTPATTGTTGTTASTGATAPPSDATTTAAATGAATVGGATPGG